MTHVPKLWVEKAEFQKQQLYLLVLPHVCAVLAGRACAHLINYTVLHTKA
jgi:hypothetical protein